MLRVLLTHQSSNDSDKQNSGPILGWLGCFLTLYCWLTDCSVTIWIDEICFLRSPPKFQVNQTNHIWYIAVGSLQKIYHIKIGGAFTNNYWSNVIIKQILQAVLRNMLSQFIRVSVILVISVITELQRKVSWRDMKCLSIADVHLL